MRVYFLILFKVLDFEILCDTYIDLNLVNRNDVIDFCISFYN